MTVSSWETLLYEEVYWPPNKEFCHVCSEVEAWTPLKMISVINVVVVICVCTCYNVCVCGGQSQLCEIDFLLLPFTWVPGQQLSHWAYVRVNYVYKLKHPRPPPPPPPSRLPATSSSLNLLIHPLPLWVECLTP